MKSTTDIKRLIETAKESSSHTTLLELANHPNKDVRYEVARNVHIDSQTFELLMNDPDNSVKYSLCHIPSAPKTVIDTLYKDDSWIVKYAAISHMLAFDTLVTSEKARLSDELMRLILENL